MNEENLFTVDYKNKRYGIKPDVLYLVLSRLSNEKVDNLEQEQVMEYLKKYKLLDTLFLDSVNVL